MIEAMIKASIRFMCRPTKTLKCRVRKAMDATKKFLRKHSETKSDLRTERSHYVGLNVFKGIHGVVV